MKKSNKRRGVSLVEMVVVILIIGILSGIGISFGGKQISEARMSTVNNNLRLIAGDIESAIIDLGFLNSEELDNPGMRLSYFSEWDAVYLTCPLDLVDIEEGTFVTSPSGSDDTHRCIMMDTVGYEDPWGNELRVYYLAPIDGTNYRVLVASAGPNGHWADNAQKAYIDKEFDDDVVMIMEPRI